MAPAISAAPNSEVPVHTQRASRSLTREPEGLYSTSQLAQHSNAMASITMRDHSGQAESHADWEDHMFIQEGEATLTLGAHHAEIRIETAKGEARGSGITGGKTVTVHPGDYRCFVPVNTPHRMVLAPGKSIRYAVVKTHP